MMMIAQEQLRCGYLTMRHFQVCFVAGAAGCHADETRTVERSLLLGAGMEPDFHGAAKG
jgi:hypothetical protein